MKNFISTVMNNVFVQIWKDASTPLEYLIALWVTGLAVLAVGGWFGLMIKWILNPNMFDGVQFGLIDYIP